MRFGAHVSIAGGLENAPIHAAQRGAEVLQMFTRSPRGGKVKPIDQEHIDLFRRTQEEHGIEAVYVHAPYIINFCSQTPRTWHGSIELLKTDLERASQLGAAYVMFHTGSAKDQSKEEALERAIQGLEQVLTDYTGSTKLLIENSAGAGSVVAGTFEEIAIMLKDRRLQPFEALAGVCFDTQHAFAAGYDLRTKEAFDHTFTQYDEVLGLETLKLFHCNDSKVTLGASKDRHEHLGKGEMGETAFKLLVQDERCTNMDLIVETPSDGQAQDIALLARLKKGS